MKKTKLEKGITLIALIITIVVLLILAVVTIGSVKDSGIIGHAQNAASGYNKAQATENSILKEYDDYIISQIKSDGEWDFSWVSRNGIWDTTAITNESEIPTGENIIVANFYKTGNRITPTSAESGEKLELGDEYKLVIEGQGKIPDLFEIDSYDVGANVTPYAWAKETNENVGSDGYYSSAYITEVSISDGITHLGDGLLAYAVSLQSLEIPNTVTYIGDQLVYNCISLKNINIPNKVTEIGIFAFAECKSLSNIDIPSSVTIIEEYAFKGVQHITYFGSAEGSPWGAKSIN